MSHIPPINLKRLQILHHHMMRNRVRYVFGGKAKMNTPVDSIKGIDCSGLVRYLVFNSTSPNLLIPDGSWNQRTWCQQTINHSNNLEQVNSYESVKPFDENDASLYLCFLNPVGRTPGHVWFVCRGFTMESHGGHGPNERPWNTPVLRQNVDYIFKWKHVWI